LVYVKILNQLNVTGGAFHGPDNSGDWLAGKVYEVDAVIARWLVASKHAEFYGPVTDPEAFPETYVPPPLEPVVTKPPERLHLRSKHEPAKEDN
jgi:hypothetical protein